MAEDDSQSTSTTTSTKANSKSFQDDSLVMSEDEQAPAAATAVDYRLNEPMTLRKNLQLTFEEQAPMPVPMPSNTATVKQKQSVSDRIKLFETGGAAAPSNIAAGGFGSSILTSSTTGSSSSTTAFTTFGRDERFLPPASRALSVYLRLRPLVNRSTKGSSNANASATATTTTTVEIVPSHSQLQPATKIRTHPPALAATGTNTAGSKTTATTVKEFEFSRVFDSPMQQSAFYRETCQPLVQGLFPGAAGKAGESALLLAYGITNAGKTHTMLGPANTLSSDTAAVKQPSTALPEEWGLIPRALHDLLSSADTNNVRQSVSLHLQCYEIYKDQVYDLLPRHDAAAAVTNKNVVQQRVPLKVADYQGQVMVRGLARHSVDAIATGLSLLEQAAAARQTATNQLNAASSRSHAVYQFTVVTSTSSNTAVGPKRAALTSTEKHLWMVDLAGSERSKRTAGVDSFGTRQKEAAWINQSLMTLMRCLQALRDNQEQPATASANPAVVPPYRDCKLTHLLSSHWSSSDATGNGSTAGKPGKTTMIVNVHGGADDYNETQHVLAYAAMAKTIQLLPAAVTSTTATAKTAAAGGTAVEYGYNGRKKRTMSSSVKTKIAKIVRKLSPKQLRKRKSVVADPTGGTKPPLAAVANSNSTQPTQSTSGQWMPAAKRRRAEKASDNSSSKTVATAGAVSACVFPVTALPNLPAADTREMLSLKMTLSVAQAETQVLRQEKKELLEQLEETETVVRVEVSEEMDQHMQAMREQYQDIIERLKSRLSAAQPDVGLRSAKKVQMDRAAAKVDDLLCKVEECEEEMQRMRQEHQVEMDDVVRNYTDCLRQEATKFEAATIRGDSSEARVQELALALQKCTTELQAAQETHNVVSMEGAAVLSSGENDDKRVSQLEAELADSHAQITKLKRSKKELIASYEKLLRDDDDSGDEEEEEPEDEEDNSESEDENPRKQDSRRLTRRQIQHQEVALPPTNKPKRSTRTSMRRPLGTVSSNVQRSSSSLSDDSFGPSQWLFPKKTTKKDSETGAFVRPRGRAPVGAEAWDGSKGAWRLSVA